MAEEKYDDETKKVAHRGFSLPEYDLRDQSTIYKLTLWMKNRFSLTTPTPEGAGEVRDLLLRLVEIDNKSRELLKKVVMLLEKDKELEIHVKKRIEDPRVSRMWLLVEQLLDCQDCITQSIEEEDEVAEKTWNDRFKVRNLLNGTESEAATTTTSAADAK